MSSYGGVSHSPGEHPRIVRDEETGIAPRYDSYKEPEAGARYAEQSQAFVGCDEAMEKAKTHMTDIPRRFETYGSGTDLISGAQRNDGDQPGYDGKKQSDEGETEPHQNPPAPGRQGRGNDGQDGDHGSPGKGTSGGVRNRPRQGGDAIDQHAKGGGFDFSGGSPGSGPRAGTSAYYADLLAKDNIKAANLYGPGPTGVGMGGWDNPANVEYWKSQPASARPAGMPSGG